MNLEEELIRISDKIDKYHKEDIKRTKRAKYENLSYILWGFDLGATGLSIIKPNFITIFIAVAFVVGGFGAFVYSARFKVD
ncbi:MAG: hypothetical protein IMY88_03425 [Chloroflexi bacterium]|nr:hypothetical protein [Chloroflexota bacterium]